MRRVAQIVAVLLLTGLAAPALAGKKPPPAGLAFKPPVQLLTSGGIYGIQQAEPSIRVDSGGRIYVAAPAASGIGCELWTLPSTLASQQFVVPPDGGAGGADCDLAVSRTTPAGQAFPTVSYSSLYAANLISGKSVDGGQTFTAMSPVSSTVFGDDRQWLEAGEGSVVYQSYHLVATNNIGISRSTDGGATFASTALAPSPGNGMAIDAAHAAQAAYNNELGPLAVDLHSTASPKPVYTLFTAPDSAAENANSGGGSTRTFNHDVFLATSLDGGVTWVDSLIYSGPVDRTYDHIFPALAVDAGGGLWAAWVSDEMHAYVTHRVGSTWTAPLRVDTGPVLANVYPWLVGGAAGRADVVWYGGTSTATATPNMDLANEWGVRFAQVSWARKGGVTVTAQASANGHVIHYGSICTTGVTCNSTDNSRLLFDFFQVALTPDGRAAIAWADDHIPGGAQVYVTVQCSGTSATTGAALPNTC